MLRDYIEHDALAMRRRKCCDFEYELQQEFDALQTENERLRKLVSEADWLMQGVLDNANDTVTVSDLPCCDTLFDRLVDYRMEMRDLGFDLPDVFPKKLRHAPDRDHSRSVRSSESPVNSNEVPGDMSREPMADNSKLWNDLSKARALAVDMFSEFVMEYGNPDDMSEYEDRMRGVGIKTRSHPAGKERP